MSSSSSSSLTQLKVELEEERALTAKLAHDERQARSRAEALAKKCERLEKDERAALARIESLEMELLSFKQQADKALREADRALAEARDAHSAELNALTLALSESESKLETVRMLERSKAARIDELQAQLAHAPRPTVETPAARKRPHDDEDVQRQLRELEARNQALERGAAGSARLAELSERLAASERHARKLQGLLDAALQQGEYKARYEAAMAQVERLSRADAEREAWREEKQTWRELGGPEQAARRVTELQKQLAAAGQRTAELEARLERAEREAREGGKAKAEAAEAIAALERAQTRLAVAEGERDAAQKLVCMSDAPLEPRLAELGGALEEARGEIRGLRRQLDEQLRAARLPVPPQQQQDIRVLHVKPQFRADQPLLKPTPAAQEDSETDKLRSQRLKEVFQRQIQMFKDAVFVLMGYKVDMTPDAKPQVRVRSMFAEQANDFLLFRYDPDTSSVEMLQTEFAKSLDSNALAYLHRCDSPPAFLASLTLMLFEKTTMRMGGGSLPSS